MATLTNQQAALKDAMIRAREIAAKLAKEQPHILSKANSKTGEETRKRALIDKAPEPPPKRNLLDHDPQLVAQKVANLLQQKTGLGSLLTEEITIPNNLVGLVIGRGGEMINKLQSESGAKVQVAPDPPAENLNTDRKINITGTFEAVNTAKKIIEEIRSTGKIPEQLIIGTLPGEFSIEMLIPRGKVGLVIGKGGENIKNLQEQAGCKMVLLQDGEYANAAEKPLRMTGEKNAVFYGQQLVHDLIVNKELEGMNPPDGQGYKEINVPRESVGLIIGTKGANIHQIQLETGCKIRFKNDMEGPTKIAMLSGTPQQLTVAENKLRDIISAGKAGSQRNNDGVLLPSLVGGAMGQVGGVGGFQMGTFYNSNLLPGHKNFTICVPAKKCGLVIGKGGETIKFIKSETGIKIEIEKSSLDPHFRIFKAQGTDDMIEKALVIIREKLNDDSISSTLVQTPALQWTGQEQVLTQVPIQPVVWTDSPSFVSSWNQSQAIPQPTWDTHLHQWHQVSNSAVVGHWPNQQQWVQQNVSQNQSQIIHSVPQVSNAIVTPIDPSQMNVSQSTMQQANYSAAWTNYYQQQQQQQQQHHAQLLQQQKLLQQQPQQSQQQPQQYYQHYSIQQQQTSFEASGTIVPAPTSIVEVSSTAGTTQNISEYQGNLVEHYKQYGLVQSQ